MRTLPGSMGVNGSLLRVKVLWIWSIGGWSVRLTVAAMLAKAPGADETPRMAAKQGMGFCRCVETRRMKQHPCRFYV
jgi:hypothetical protein